MSGQIHNNAIFPLRDSWAKYELQAVKKSNTIRSTSTYVLYFSFSERFFVILELYQKIIITGIDITAISCSNFEQQYKETVNYKSNCKEIQKIKISP